MKAFRFIRPGSVSAAQEAASRAEAVLKAGGIDLMDRMKERVDEPDDVVALLSLDDDALRAITKSEDGTLRIGALATLSAIAQSKDVRETLPALAEAAGGAASFQIRNRATLGGNLAQQTRCGYFRHKSFPCFKRGAKSCPVKADGAVQEMAGIFGIESCACAHPASLPPVLAAADALVVAARYGSKSPEDLRTAIGKFYDSPVRGRATDTVLVPGDVITAVEIPPLPAGSAVAYTEVRQKAAFDWALVSCGVRISGDPGSKKITDARVWLGSVAPTPHRATAAEAVLKGATYAADIAAKAGEAAAEGAMPLTGNAYKVDLVKVAVRRTLEQAAGRWR